MRGGARHRWLLVAAVGFAPLVPGAALAQTGTTGPPDGSQGPRPTVTGEVTGDIAAGSTLTIAADATMPGGWEGLHLIEVVALSGSEELEHIRFDIEDNTLRVGQLPIAVGTGAVAETTHLRVSGADVVVTTGAGNLSFSVDADVVSAFPEDVRFRVSATTDDDETVSADAERSEAEGGGLTWGAVAAAVVLALLAGGVIGNIAASRRRPPPRMSVYGSIQRRIDDEKSATPERG